ncbi:MAG: hypothetical protein ABJB16_08565 [Saprospiraceae bacterium]
MKSILSGKQPPHIIELTHPLLKSGGTERNITRCKLVDSFNFVMGLIEEEPYPVRNPTRRTIMEIKRVNVADHESWKSGFYKDDYTFEEGD